MTNQEAAVVVRAIRLMQLANHVWEISPQVAEYLKRPLFSREELLRFVTVVPALPGEGSPCLPYPREDE
jgi:hypothetical protein